MKALNRAIEKAFAHSEGDNNIDELLLCLGQELGCRRISIFEENDQGQCDNTYEWCAPGVAHERILLQHIAVSRFDSWHDRLKNREMIVVRAPEELRASDPDVYELFEGQRIQTALVMLLAFHGVDFGFALIEDPADEVMADHDMVMPGIRYILSSLIYSRNLVTRLKRLSYIDPMTGAGNRVSLQDHLKQLDRAKSVGVVAVDVLGWDRPHAGAPHIEMEQTLLRAGEILTNLYDQDQVFRVSTGEFIIVQGDVDRVSFETGIRALRGLLRQQNLLASVAGEWQERLSGSIDDFIHAVHQKTEDEKRRLQAHRRQGADPREIRDDALERADIRLPRGDAFFRLADQYLSGLYEEYAVAIVTDINYFKLYNDIFGRKAGNIFLETIANLLGETAEKYGGLCGYMGGDNFCLILPTLKDDAREMAPIIEQMYDSLEFPDGFFPAMGVYFSNDRRESAIALYDRASSALSEIKGDYMRHIHYYNAETEQRHREDKLLLMQIKEGLSRNEFLFYVQPQVNDTTGQIIGGEALVRWMHDGRMIPPGQFIPILEKTGYVFAVDCHVWESVARWQRSLIDRGVAPVPISVNVSRVDFYFDDIAERFIQMIRRYDLPAGLIGVEITESAITDNTDVILGAIQRLHDAGFHILMDDFGSGSSSLSMLHTMNLDVLKTDVEFMSKDARDSRAISIVESVISMAHMIGMSVVTEGVETEAQKDNLIAIGDSFAQGYYFYKPMPVERFEELIRDRGNVAEGYSRRAMSAGSPVRFRDMIREGLVSETLLDNILRAAAVFRVEDGDVTVAQINPLYARTAGLRAEGQTRVSDDWDEGAVKALLALMARADTHTLGGSEGRVTVAGLGGAPKGLDMRVFLIYAFDRHRYYLSVLS